MDINFLSIDELNLSVRASNCLHRAGVHTFGEMVELYKKGGLYTVRNLGKKSADEVVEKINEYQNAYPENNQAENVADEETKSEITISDVMSSHIYKDEILGYVKSNDIYIGDWNIGNRPKNQLLRNGFSYLSDIIFMTAEEFVRLPAMGINSVEDILGKINEYLCANEERILAVCKGDISLIYSDDVISSNILGLYKDEHFAGFSFGEFVEKLNLPAEIEESRIKSVIGRLIADEKLEYVDYRCYRRYTKFMDYLSGADCIEERSREVIIKKLNGETLESIGNEYDLSRERVRQIIKKDSEKVRNAYVSETGITCFDEDYYEHFYSTYAFEKADAEKWFGIGQNVLLYMEMRDIKQGKTELQRALEDSLLGVSLKLKVKSFLNRNKILLDGIWVEKKRNELEKYVISKFCKEDVSYDEFVKIYNSFLESEQVPYDEKVYYTHDVLRTRKNILSDSRYALWKQNEQIRYYDIDARDYTELLSTLDLGGYENIEISTLKFINDYPEVMQKYDIRDQYELHNLLRKIIPANSYNQFRCGRTPMLQFGEFNRHDAIVEVLINNAPIEYEALLEVIKKEYGYESGAIPWDAVSGYYHKGMCRVDYKKMSDGNKALLKEKLTDDFYFIDEIKNIYSDCVSGADMSEVNPYNLKLMGFSVFSRYAVQNHPTLDAYFTHILTKEDFVDLTEYRRRFVGIQAFSASFGSLKKKQVIFELDHVHIVNIRKLEALGVTKEKINAFCDKVYAFVEDNTFFSIASLRNKGFEDDLYNLDFSDWFYAKILASDERFSSGQVFSNIIIYKGKTDVTIKNFETWLVRSFSSVSVCGMMEELVDNYGCRVDEKHEVVSRLDGTEIYYDNILDRLYSSAEAYYRELEEAEGM